MLTVAELGSFEGTTQQLRQVVLDQVTTYPESHDQTNWISLCGTTACVAGWTLLFQNGYVPIGTPWDIVDEAQELLGLNDYDAMRLFHFTTNDQARMALKFLANGEDIDWDAVGHKLKNHTDEQLDILIRNNLLLHVGTEVQ